MDKDNKQDKRQPNQDHIAPKAIPARRQPTVEELKAEVVALRQLVPRHRSDARGVGYDLHRLVTLTARQHPRELAEVYDLTTEPPGI